MDFEDEINYTNTYRRAYGDSMPRHFEFIGLIAVMMANLEEDMATVSYTVNVKPISIDEVVFSSGNRPYLPGSTRSLYEDYAEALRKIDRHEFPDLFFYMVELEKGVRRLRKVRNRIVHSYPRFSPSRGVMVFEHAQKDISGEDRLISTLEVETSTKGMVYEAYLYQRLCNDIREWAAHAVHGAESPLVERVGVRPKLDHLMDLSDDFVLFGNEFFIFLEENNHTLQEYYYNGWRDGWSALP